MSIPANPNRDGEGQACDPWSQQGYILHSWSATHRLSKTVFFLWFYVANLDMFVYIISCYGSIFGIETLTLGDGLGG